MTINNIIDLIVEIVIFYYSLIKPMQITTNLRTNIKSTILQMWVDFMGNELMSEDIDIIVVMNNHLSVLSVYDSNLYQKITHVIISYFNRTKMIDQNMSIIEIYSKPYIPGMTITHSQIMNIIDFYKQQNV